MGSRTGVVGSTVEVPVIRRAVETCLADFLEDRARAGEGGRLVPEETVRLLGEFVLGGGKLIRPVLCVVGWHAAGAHSRPSSVVAVAAALEMFHAFTLIHDDVMDASATRRGRPALHRLLADCYQAGRDRAVAERLGAGAAVLLGDLALVWSDELIHTAGLSRRQLARVLPLIHTMRQEVMHGQYLDITCAGRPTPDLEAALRIARHKTAGYTVEHPLLIGAALSNASQHLRQTLSAYALPLGEAFQLRDDLLGVFGDPQATGKSRLDDLREGKHTALLALALQRADPAQQHALRTLIGNPALDEPEAARIRAILTATGAQKTVERMITDRCQQAVQALHGADCPPAAADALRSVADTVTRRTA